MMCLRTPATPWRGGGACGLVFLYNVLQAKFTYIREPIGDGFHHCLSSSMVHGGVISELIENR